MLEPKESKKEKEEMSEEPIQEAQEPKQELKEEPKQEAKEELELSAQSSESVEPLKHNPEGSVGKKELNLFAQKRAKTTRDIVFSKLFK
jgi:hypothetical protein